MKTELEQEDIEKIATRVAEMLHTMGKQNYKLTLVDVDGLAEYLHVPTSWVYEQTRNRGDGCIPKVKVGKYVRFNIHEVLEWLKRQ